MIQKPYRTERKVWGFEHWLANGPAYCAKILVIHPGASTSVHYHQRKVETLFLAQGRLAVFLAGEFPAQSLVEPIYAMEPGDLVTIQPYQRHAFQCVGEKEAILFEASTQHFEDDSFREAPSRPGAE